MPFNANPAHLFSSLKFSKVNYSSTRVTLRRVKSPSWIQTGPWAAVWAGLHQRRLCQSGASASRRIQQYSRFSVNQLWPDQLTGLTWLPARGPSARAAWKTRLTHTHTHSLDPIVQIRMNLYKNDSTVWSYVCSCCVYFLRCKSYSC